ncbi:Surfeit locus protein 6 [Chionoecetes opilio]|uniref:Surfeit locus protein 6 n=1 Tax=Chionoecetes opilio TaxID=41210 RepID=A0A8J4XX72_CHIOP|nr:Surfeit locus protein 6 [Chionoecetes opilio]
MNDILATNHMGKKNKKMNKKMNKKIKKKIKNISTIPDEIKSLATKEAEAEDLAESVDSGCIPDSSSDIVADVPDIAQIEASVLKENTFISSLLKWMPSDLPGREPEPEVETSRGKKRKYEAKSKQDETRHNNKKQKVDVDLAETHADLDQLQDKYRETLIDLRNVKPVKPKKPIYNQKGQLVFSKFDFSNNNSLSGDMDSNKKSKDLKQILSQTLKEKEKMKQLEKRGDKEGAISIAEQKAWSNALQKAEGKKDQ